MEHTTVEEYAARVRRGAQLFDTKRPGWAHKVNRDLLDMGDPSFCVLSQVEQDRFTYAARGIFRDFVSDYRYLLVDYGFDILSKYLLEHGQGDYKILNELWIDEILKRTDS